MGYRIIWLGLRLVILSLFVQMGIAKKNSNQWLRVITGETSIIDLDKTSLVLEPGQLIRADFKTTLLKDEPVPNVPGSRYLSRIDSIQFNRANTAYRILKTSLFDSSGKVALSSQPASADVWKPISGDTGYRLYNAAIQLAPFGSWIIKSYRYASGETPSKDDPAELSSLIGVEISLRLGNVQVSNKTCASPNFEPLTITSDEFVSKFGSPLKVLGIETTKIDALMLTCKTIRTVVFPESEIVPTLKAKGTQPEVEYTVSKQADPRDFPEQTLILRESDRRALMLWDGIFLEIERPGNPFLP